MAKEITATDIVPVSVLNNIAKRIRTRAAAIAKSKKAALASSRRTPNVYNPNLIGIKAPRVTKNQISIELSLDEVGMAFEKGSKAHSIRAKNKPLLKFWGTNGHNYLVTIPEVNHPGFAKRPFLEPAKKETRQENLDDIAKASSKNIRLIVSTMKRVV
jgi:hypothetical protein